MLIFHSKSIVIYFFTLFIYHHHHYDYDNNNNNGARDAIRLEPQVHFFSFFYYSTNNFFNI